MQHYHVTVPILREVYMWPSTGFSDSVWDTNTTSDATWPTAEFDSLARTSRRVSEALSKALAEEAIEVPRGSIRLMPRGQSSSFNVEIEVPERIWEREEMPFIYVPIGFHLHDSEIRAELTATAWEMVLERIAELRGWDPRGVHRAARKVRSGRYQHRSYSLWRKSPDRTMEFRLVGSIHDDGFFRLRLEFRSCGSAEPSSFSPQFVGGSTSPSFTRLAKSLRWAPGGYVRATIADGAEFTFDPRHGGLDGDLDGDEVEPPPRKNGSFATQGVSRGSNITVAFRPVDPRAFSVFVGAGPTSGVPEAYLNALWQFGEQVRQEGVWRDWWLQLGRSSVTFNTWFEREQDRVSVRLQDDAVTATTWRPSGSIPKAREAAALAREDFLRALARIQRRAKLADHPKLTDTVNDNSN